MRRSERDARLARLAERVLGDAPRVLSSNLTVALSGREVARDDVSPAAAAAPFDGALLGVAAGPTTRAQIAALCARLRDGAALLLVAPSRPTFLARARGLLTRTPPARVTPADLAEALLLAGLRTPRVHDDVPGLLLVSARVPSARGALDAFFAPPALFPQPAGGARR